MYPAELHLRAPIYILLSERNARRLASASSSQTYLILFFFASYPHHPWSPRTETPTRAAATSPNTNCPQKIRLSWAKKRNHKFALCAASILNPQTNISSTSERPQTTALVFVIAMVVAHIIWHFMRMYV
jgi:hypothetical protein